MFIIRRTDQGGGWLAKSGSEKTYTMNPRSARRFKTRREAEQACCENEVVEEL